MKLKRLGNTGNYTLDNTLLEPRRTESSAALL
jgi:hypothetical protein